MQANIIVILCVNKFNYNVKKIPDFQKKPRQIREKFCKTTKKQENKREKREEPLPVTKKRQNPGEISEKFLE
ncbi:hypothetical protein [Dysosmobacter sp. Sow4_B12]|uniref:hypothetical protein n=1 Tax=Dysosmobacter sp. Sow4_B12 TaxID=3438777 RepID=UPI003F91E276